MLSMLDPNAKRLLWYLFGGSKGAQNRIRIIEVLRERPSNINQLSDFLGLDYKGVQHHISVLEKNNLVTKAGEKYDVLYFISDYLQHNLAAYDEIKDKIFK
jgi:DNA-binding transcriptional ArsR family regulator